MASEFLRMQGINKSFDGTQALRGVDFSAVAGEVHAISGENGAGKSTLVKILSGALASDSGEVLLEGQPADLSSPVRARRYIGSSVMSRPSRRMRPWLGRSRPTIR